MPDIFNVLDECGFSYKASFAERPLNVAHLELDSRKVTKNTAFIAIKGEQTDGAKFVPSALVKGAEVVLVDSQCAFIEMSAPIIRVDKLKEGLAQLAARFYHQPSETLHLVGVTGTNGKSTTTAMVAALWDALKEDTQGDAAVIGTLGVGKADDLTPLANTTPSSVEIQRILKAQANLGRACVAMEVSSHGLVQKRVAGCQFDVGVFTNLSRDHLDYHGTMEAYGEAKWLLFSDHTPKIAIINADDPLGAQWLTRLKGTEITTYAYGHYSDELAHLADFFVGFSDLAYLPEGLNATLHVNDSSFAINTPLYGEFNLYNLAAAVATVVALGMPVRKLPEACATLQPVAGRMQAFKGRNQATCVVDYAHTPDALKAALSALKQHTPGRLWCVFGCGGDRDKGKRPLMAQRAAEVADMLVITSDNPRSEPPMDIINDVVAGLANEEKARSVAIESRADAIEYVLSHAHANDVVLVAGKGHEDYQIIGDEVLPFCDRSFISERMRGTSI